MKLTLSILEEKLLNNIDYQFLDSIKHRFPANNAYFLVCLAEIVNNYEDDRNEDVLDDIINKAYELYNNTNISSYLSE